MPLDPVTRTGLFGPKAGLGPGPSSTVRRSETGRQLAGKLKNHQSNRNVCGPIAVTDKPGAGGVLTGRLCGAVGYPVAMVVPHPAPASTRAAEAALPAVVATARRRAGTNHFIEQRIDSTRRGLERFTLRE